MHAHVILFLCIYTFLQPFPFVKSHSTTSECDNVTTPHQHPQIVLLKKEVLLMKGQLEVASQQLKDILTVQKPMLEYMQKWFEDSYPILNINPHVCFETSAKSGIPYCAEGWLVIQRRVNGAVDFYRGWKDYRQGFGYPAGEFWIGLEVMHNLTKNRTYKLRIDLEDFEGNTRYAEYSTFAISDEAHGHTLSIGTYSGTAGDALTRHNNKPFLTKDHSERSPKSSICPLFNKGAWWYNACYDSNLNGLYHRSSTAAYGVGVVWRQWKGYRYSLQTSIMKIKPVN